MYVMAAVAAASAIYGYQQQKKSITQMAKIQQSQIDSQSQQRTMDKMEEARKLRAEARASAAEAGVSGNSVQILMDDIEAQHLRDAALIETNRKNGVDASGAEASARLRSSRAEMYGQLGQAAGSAAGAYTSNARYNATVNTDTGARPR